MQQPIRNLFYIAGLISPLWLAVGLIITGSQYPGYSHIDQAMSVLGAVDAPTHVLSPLLNNYSLGMLLILFGVAVFSRHTHSSMARLSAVLIMVHGLASMAAGHFSCDTGCSLQNPSTQPSLHMLASAIIDRKSVV